MGGERPGRLLWATACAAAALALLLTYSNHFHNSFHFDDWHTVEQNIFIRDLRNLPRFFTDARTFSSLPTNQSYRPLVTATLAVDYRLGGLDPFWFHLDSFLLFAITAALLVPLFWRALGSRWLALFGATLYGLHAVNAETVNYVISRSDILSTLGAVAMLWTYSGFPRARRLQLHLVPAVLGVLAKEQGAMAAPLLLLWITLVERGLSLPELLAPRTLWRSLREALPAFVACGATLALALRMAPTFLPGGGSRLGYAMTQPWVALHYALMFAWPSRLSADTDWTPLSSAADPRLALGVAFVAGALWLAWRASRSPAGRPAALGLLWFFVALLPTSSVVPLSEVMNDHRMYFPLVGLSLAAACGAGLLLERLRPRLERLRLHRALPAAAAVVVLAGQAAATRARNEVWRTEESLWRDVTEKSPGNARGWMNYGLARMARGDWAEAERCYRRGLALAPTYGYLHTNLAIVEAARGNGAAAEREFREGIRLAPQAPALRFYLARWLHQVGRAGEAEAELRQALAASPADEPAWSLLLQVLLERRAWAELAEAAEQALRLHADHPTARSMLRVAQGKLAAPGAEDPAPSTPEALLSLSLSLHRSGAYEGSIAACDRALALRPDYAEAFNNRCAALNELGRHREAAEACQAALRIRPEFELARNNLAAALGGLGQGGPQDPGALR